MQTEKAKSSHFDRTRRDKNQIFPTLVYTNWANKEPSNGDGYGEDCGVTRQTGTTWNDGKCYHKQPSICEMI